MCWENIPDPLLVRIFCYLGVADVSSASQTCSRWHSISQDNSVWRQLFKRDFLKGKPKKIRDPDVTWQEEYVRIWDKTPRHCSQVLDAHTDEVLHVSFSHRGDSLVSCSKDGTVCVWKMDGGPAAILGHRESLKKRFEWRYTWASRYNMPDTLLLVAGVISDIHGEIAIFHTNNNSFQANAFDYQIICRVENNPYDVLGDWCAENHFLCGRLVDEEILGAAVYLCESVPGVKSNLSLATASEVFKNVVITFRDEGTNYLRCLLVSNRKLFPNDHVFEQVPRNTMFDIAQDPDEKCLKIVEENRICLIFLFNGLTSLAPHQLGFKMIWPGDLENAPVVSAPDKVIDMQGHIVGLNLSPDKRFLHVNVRAWPTGAQPSQQLLLPIASEIEMKVVDLKSLTLTSDTYEGHKGFTDSREAFYIYLDVGELLVASGSEDGNAKIWDRHYGCAVSSLKHDACVNCTALCPANQQILVTASDDYKIKIWKSRNLMRAAAQQ